ncbi:MAG: diadenylate cyclase CdaA [Verrucomicrobia bacterium]|nr:diadenylate cyclase CdaA [Verrucomicrobiota bacterium]MCG2681509.1 diadenylate cyclase CdaA [Kiritimatiellia bacterium]MBU4248273.1 diadenylate cyclase CdaA [Verrucomicrobiota bacterium]MBU4289889.1 diadenylate cyclase CdaA [Verrucomicrobiota bacterium]MBU4428188.1 diadenylate cyclase CdaA [Verrucomicrobiota bacterium]
MQWLSRVGFPDIFGWIEIACLAVVFYYLLYFFRGTRATPVLTGFLFVFVILIVATRLFHLDALNWIVGRFSVYLAVAFLVIFQPEIRWALGELGKQHLFGTSVTNRALVDNLVQAVNLLMKRRIGALIAIERDIGTRPIQETGIMIDSAVSPELLASIFYPYTPLHDGGVIISGNRIVAARCMFPLSQSNAFGKAIGTRHRAAVGLTDETDAVVVVVSEETGMISVSHEGRLVQDLELDELKRFLSDILLKSQDTGNRWRWMKKSLNIFSTGPRSA